MKKRKTALYVVMTLLLVLGAVALVMWFKYQQAEKETAALVKKPASKDLGATEIEKMLSDKDAKKRFQALKQLKKLEDPVKIKILMPLLKKDDNQLKTMAVGQLLVMDNEQVKKALLELYAKEKSPLIRSLIKNKYNPDQGADKKMDTDNVVKEPEKKEAAPTDPAASPEEKVDTPENKEAAPVKKEATPEKKEAAPVKKEAAPAKQETTPTE